MSAGTCAQELTFVTILAFSAFLVFSNVRSIPNTHFDVRSHRLPRMTDVFHKHAYVSAKSQTLGMEELMKTTLAKELFTKVSAPPGLVIVDEVRKC